MPLLWNRYGFAWGGNYNDNGRLGKADSMHYEFMGTPADADQMTALALYELTGEYVPVGGSGSSRKDDPVAVIPITVAADNTFRSSVMAEAGGDSIVVARAWITVGSTWGNSSFAITALDGGGRVLVQQRFDVPNNNTRVVELPGGSKLATVEGRTDAEGDPRRGAGEPEPLIVINRTPRRFRPAWCGSRRSSEVTREPRGRRHRPFRVDFRVPFRGSVAVASGLLTRAVLHGPAVPAAVPRRVRRADVEADLALRSLAAACARRRAGCARRLLPAEKCWARPAVRARARRGDRSRAAAGPARAAGRRGGRAVRRTVADATVAAVTSPVRTALDLACRGSLVEAVVAVDALAHAFGFPPGDVMRCSYDHPGRRGAARLSTVVRLADPLAESPMETRVRLAIVLDGLPAPELQVPVGPYRLDMAYPECKLGVEHDGGEHREERRALRDLDRQAYFTARGWRIVRFPKHVVLHEPARIPWTVRRAMIAASGTPQRLRAS